MTSIFEIMDLSLWFVFTAAPIMLLVFAFYVGMCLSKKRKISFLFHWMDLLIPFITTALWCRVQSYSFYIKSLGNLAEICVIGLVWGGLFLVRAILSLKNQKIPMWKYAVILCIVTVVLAFFAPTFPE